MCENLLESFCTICSKTLYSILTPRVSVTLQGPQRISSECVATRAKNYGKGFSNHVVDATRRNLFFQASYAFCLFCLVASSLVPRGRRECDVTRLWAPCDSAECDQSFAHSCPTRQIRWDGFCQCQTNKMVRRYVPVWCLAFEWGKGSKVNVAWYWEAQIYSVDTYWLTLAKW